MKSSPTKQLLSSILCGRLAMSQATYSNQFSTFRSRSGYPRPTLPIVVMDSGLIAEAVVERALRDPLPRLKKKFPFRFNLICPVQSHFQKYSPSRLPQIKSISATVPPHRGAYRDRHGRGAGCGGRGSAQTYELARGR
jgi:hypothetical protein